MHDAIGPVFDAGHSIVPILDNPDRFPDIAFRPSIVAGRPVMSDGRTVRSPAAHRAAIAEAGIEDEHGGIGPSNLRKEFDSGALAPELRETAEILDRLHALARTPPPAPTIAECRALDRLNGPERQARAGQALRLVAYRCGHLYADLVRAIALDEPMSKIGADLGGNTKDAAKHGRLRVTDALTFAHAALQDLQRWGAAQEMAIRNGAPICPVQHRAIGKVASLPEWIHEAANDDLRKMKSAA